MKTKTYLCSAIALGIGLVAALLLGLARPADAATTATIYYVRAGAAGDCSAPASPCGGVQQAINLAVGAGDEVWVAVGVYTENLAIAHAVTVRGGWNISFTVQDPALYTTTLDGRGNHNVRVENAPAGAQVNLEGLDLRHGQDGIHIWVGRVRIERCAIHDANKQAIEIDGGDVVISATRIFRAQQGVEVDAGQVEMVNVSIARTSEEGLLVEGGDGVTMTHSLIENCSLQGVQVNRASLHLFNNTIRNISADGIRVESGAVSIISNTVYSIASDGLDVSGTHIISGNLVYNTVKWGIYGHDGALTILNNRVHDSGDDGIRVADGATVLVQGNTVENAGNDGMDVRAQAATIAHNRIYTAADRGVNGENGNLTIVDNEIHHARGDGIRTAGSSTQVEIRANSVYSAGNDGIDARGHALDIAENAVRGCGDNGVRAEGDERAQIALNRILSAGLGVAVRGARLFTLTHNIVVDPITAGVEITGTGTGYLFHNTLVGGVDGVRVADPLTVTLVNNLLTGHASPISAVAGADLTECGNGVFAAPRFVDAANGDFHLAAGSPAIDFGCALTGGPAQDMDGQPRLIGRAPDAGADEFPAALEVSKRVAPAAAQTGAPLTYTISITNVGVVALHAAITDVSPLGGPFYWTATIPVGAVWTGTVAVAVPADHVGALVNVVWVGTDEGAAGVYTHTLTPGLAVSKRAQSAALRLGAPLTYTLYVTNTGDFFLNAVVADFLPVGDPISWTAGIPVGGVWTQNVVFTVPVDHRGALVNVVRAAAREGASGVYTETLAPGLAVVKRATPASVRPGGRLTYTIAVTNTGQFDLHALITDTLPLYIVPGRAPDGTLLTPGGRFTRTATIPAPGGVWSETFAVTVEADYQGTLVNVVEVWTDEGATGVYTATTTVYEGFVYLPLVVRNFSATPPPYVCPTTSSNVYSQGPAYQYDTDNPVRPAYNHADKNIALRGYTPNSDAGLLRELVDYGSDDPTQPPQLATLFSPARVPDFSNFYRVYGWLWGAGSPDPGVRGDVMTQWPVTALGMATTPGESLHIPTSGYDIGGGVEVIVLFADEDTIAFRYAREDSVAPGGYTVHVDNICTDPNLLALYNTLDAASGPRYVYVPPASRPYSYNLPTLRDGQPFGTARGEEIVVAIVDSGGFMDTRSCNEWWQARPGYTGACPQHE